MFTVVWLGLLAPVVSNHDGHPNRNFELKKSHLFNGFPFIWLNNLKSVGPLEKKIFHLKY
jgi:hypothetical protein